MAFSLVVGVAKFLPPDLAAELRKNGDIVDWLISVTENEETREGYVRQVAKFLLWTGWTIDDIFRIKREALRNGDPTSEVETKIKRFMEALRETGYSGKYRAFTLASIASLLNSKGYPLKRKLVRVDASPKLEMRVPEQQEVERFIEYASNLEKKLLYTALTDTPCRPRVHTAIRWDWLEETWWEKDTIHVSLPREFRPSPQSGPRKFEPICFLGPKTVQLLKQHRQAKINSGKVPLETDRILNITYDGSLATVRRDFDDLARLGLIRPSRKDPDGKPLEQPISPKSWRKYQFNIIDSLTDISPEWRKMLKGRDLQTERYYSKENVEELRKIYREKIYPKLWSGTITGPSADIIEAMRQEIDELKLKMRIHEQISERQVVITK